MDIEIGRHGSVDGIEEAAELSCAVAPVAAAEHPAGVNIKGGEQRRRAMAFVITTAPLGLAVRAAAAAGSGLIWRPTTSRALSTNSGSVDSLKVSVRCGCRPTARQMRWTLEVEIPPDLKSTYLAMKQAIPLMVRQGGGSIINISSIASNRYAGVPYATYCASKAALNQLTRTTAVEYANRRVRVNAILPGLMKTPMVEKSASLSERYAEGDVAEMWRRRDQQGPMGFGGDV